MAHRDFLGRIDCPHCGTKDGMKITEDRAGNPFGNCDAECHGQLRIGDKDFHRVKKFYALHPHIKKCGRFAPGDEPVTVTGGQKPVTVTGGQKPVTVKEIKQEKIHGTAGSKAEPDGASFSVPVAEKPRKRTFAEELAAFTGGGK